MIRKNALNENGEKKNYILECSVVCAQKGANGSGVGHFACILILWLLQWKGIFVSLSHYVVQPEKVHDDDHDYHHDAL